MTASRGQDERVVLPLWRPWRASQEQRELGSLATGASTLEQAATAEEVERELANRVREFERWRGVHYAGDVVSTAVVLGLESRTEVRDAAEELQRSGSAAARSLAEDVLAGSRRIVASEPPLVQDAKILWSWIAKQKLILQEQPRNTLAWADLALAHTVLGQDSAAENAIRVALAEANGNRFILRAAARYYVHHEDFDRARDILTGDTARLRSDPWLLSAEIALADATNGPQRHASYARTLLDRGFAPHDVSELASALATIDLKSGNVKRAKRLLTSAMVDPTDNSVAQAEWSVQRGLDVGSSEHLDLPRTYEARARFHYRTEEFPEALRFGELWLADQPFAVDPALFTSFLAATFMGDQSAAIRACKIGLRANRNNPTLLNNMAFSLACSGRTAEARSYLNRVQAGVSGVEAGMITATRGLIAYREHNSAAGRDYYRQAVTILMRDKNEVSAASASLFWLYEELLSGGEAIDEVLRQALSLNRTQRRSEDLVLPRRRLVLLVRRRSSAIDERSIEALGLAGDTDDNAT